MSTLIAPANGVFYTHSEAERLERIKRASFFLLRNRSAGEQLPCRNHQRGPNIAPVYHDFLTLACVPLPVDAITAQTYVLVAVNSRRDGKRLGPKEILELASRHPRTARDLMPRESGEDLYAVMLSEEAEPISASDAQRYADRIRLRGVWDFRLQPLRLRSALGG